MHYIPIYSIVPHQVLVLSPCFIVLASPKSVIEMCPVDKNCDWKKKIMSICFWMNGGGGGGEKYPRRQAECFRASTQNNGKDRVRFYRGGRDIVHHTLRSLCTMPRECKCSKASTISAN